MFCLQAYLLTKSVPRRSNRSKWKEESGFAPNLLTEGVILNDNTFLSGDILFTADGRGSVRKFLNTNGVKVTSVSDHILVKDLDTKNLEEVPVESLLKDGAMYAVIPACLYEDVNGQIVYSEKASQFIEDLVAKQYQSLYSDVELISLSSDTEKALFESQKDHGPLNNDNQRSENSQDIIDTDYQLVQPSVF